MKCNAGRFTLQLKLALTLLLLAQAAAPVHARSLNDYIPEEYAPALQQYLDSIESGDRARIAATVTYPLNAPWPLYLVTNEQEMLARFDEVFDEQLLTKIVESPVYFRWSPAVDAAIFELAGSLVWIDTDGKLILKRFHETKAAAQAKRDIGRRDPASTEHMPTRAANLGDFWQPILETDDENSGESFDEVAMEKFNEAYIRPLRKAARENNRALIAELTEYPLKRTYPVPAIANEQEMLERFDEVFDATLLQQLATAPVESLDYGSYGSFLSIGDVQIAQSEGRIAWLNHETAAGKLVEQKLLEQQRTKLHPSLHSFDRAVLEWETARFHVRIDKIGDEYSRGYRYAVWPVGTPTTEQPDLLINDGYRDTQGSGGNHDYIFKNGSYTYICAVTVMGANESPPGYLSVLHDATDEDLLMGLAFEDEAKRILGEPVERVL